MGHRLHDGEVLLGVCNSYPAAGIVEGICAGWDFVWIDGQHGQMSYDAVAHAVRAAEAIGVETLVRSPSHEPGLLGLFADLAPAAIMVPMVNSARQAQAVARSLRYPPQGERSFGGRRVIDLNGRAKSHLTELLVVVQIESAKAVDNVEAIAATEGVDALFFGADDMKVALELPLDTQVADTEPLRRAMEDTARASREHGKFAGCVASSPETARLAVEMGYQLLVGGSDSGFLKQGAEQSLGQLRQIVEGALIHER